MNNSRFQVNTQKIKIRRGISDRFSGQLPMGNFFLGRLIGLLY